MTFSHKLVSIVFLSIIALPLSAKAGDNWQAPGRPQVCANVNAVQREKCQTWLSTVKQADNRVSCCGDADAWISDNFKPIGDDLWAEITADYPEGISTDEEGNSFAVPPLHKKGDWILIPKEKRNYAKEDAGNSSGHGVVFMRPSDGYVLCWFAPPLI